MRLNHGAALPSCSICQDSYESNVKALDLYKGALAIREGAGNLSLEIHRLKPYGPVGLL